MREASTLTPYPAPQLVCVCACLNGPVCAKCSSEMKCQLQRDPLPTPARSPKPLAASSGCGASLRSFKTVKCHDAPSAFNTPTRRAARTKNKDGRLRVCGENKKKYLLWILFCSNDSQITERNVFFETFHCSSFLRN